MQYGWQESRTGGGSSDHWNRVFKALAAETRRRVLASLLREPVDEGVSLPSDLLGSIGESQHQLVLSLRHSHLPKLAEVRYIRWQREPLRAYRGPNFEQVIAVVRILREGNTELPPQLSCCPWLVQGSD